MNPNTSGVATYRNYYDLNAESMHLLSSTKGKAIFVKRLERSRDLHLRAVSRINVLMHNINKEEDESVARVTEHAKEEHDVTQNKALMHEVGEERKLKHIIVNDMIYAVPNKGYGCDRESQAPLTILAMDDYYDELDSLFSMLENQQEEIKEVKESNESLSSKCLQKDRIIYNLSSDLKRTEMEVDDLKTKVAGGEAAIKEEKASKDFLSYKCLEKDWIIYRLSSDLMRSETEVADLKTKLDAAKSELKKVVGLFKKSEKQSQKNQTGDKIIKQRSGCFGWLKK